MTSTLNALCNFIAERERERKREAPVHWNMNAFFMMAYDDIFRLGIHKILPALLGSEYKSSLSRREPWLFVMFYRMC